MLCAHRVAADVRWRFLSRQFVLISIVVLSAVADVRSTPQASDESFTDATLTETSTLLTNVPSTENVTIKQPENETQSTPIILVEITTKSVEVPTEIPEEPETEVTTRKVETTEKPEVPIEKSEVSSKEADRQSEVSTEKPEATTENVTPGKAEVSASEKKVENVEVTTENNEENRTESASELALQSVQLAVVVKAPIRPEFAAYLNNATEEYEEYTGFEGSADDDMDDDDDDEHGMMEYEEDEEEGGKSTTPKIVSSTSTSASISTTVPTSTMAPTSSQTPLVENVDVEIIKENFGGESTPTVPVQRKPRHSQTDALDYVAVTTTLKPRRRRPNRYKEERRVPVTYQNGYPRRNLVKSRRYSKGRPVYRTTTVPTVETTTENNLNSFNQVDTYTPGTTTPVPQRRLKRRKKKVRRQKQQNKPQESQVPAETRTAIEAAAAAAAAESLQSDLFPIPSSTVSTKKLETTAGPRSVRQNDADVSIQQSEVNPDGSYSFSYDIVDDGRHRKTEVGAPDNVVSGRYSYIDANGRSVDTEYTAGPRGFRAIGTDIARTMDLSQLGSAPIPPPDGRYSPEYDRYSDPNEDPSYQFQYKTDTASRTEVADSRGDVEGQYSFYDDDGEKHVVRYEAGAEKGFNVRNSFPDNNIPPGLFFPGRGRIPSRGRTAILQHRNGAYRFTAVGPDSRREECSDSSNYRRGSYVYLDDKGVQRTVIYEAGPNIGYRIITNPAATIPRCPPPKGAPGWQNMHITVGSDGPYYGSTSGYGAPSPAPTWPSSISPNPSKYPYNPTTGRPIVTIKPVTSVPVTGKPSLDRDRPRPQSRPGQGPPSRPGQGPPSRPGQGPPSRPGQGPPSRPGQRPPSRPGQRPSSVPGPRPTTYKPCKENPSDPDNPTQAPRPGPQETSGPQESSGSPGILDGSIDSSDRTKNPKFDETFGVTTTRRIYTGTNRPSRPNTPSEDGGGGGVGTGAGGNGEGGWAGGAETGAGGNGGGGWAGGGAGGTGTGAAGGAGAGGTGGTGAGGGGKGGGSWGGGKGGAGSGGGKGGGNDGGGRPQYPYPPYNPDGYHFSCCRDRLLVDPPNLDDSPARLRPIRTYVQSIDLSSEVEGPGRAENPSIALERDIREHERHPARHQRRRRRRRRRSAP